MRLRLGLFALISFVVVILAIALSSFVVDPENIGVRLALYALALVAVFGVILFSIFAIIAGRSDRTGPGR
jgi:hypothetical protein